MNSHWLPRHGIRTRSWQGTNWSRTGAKPPTAKSSRVWAVGGLIVGGTMRSILLTCLFMASTSAFAERLEPIRRVHCGRQNQDDIFVENATAQPDSEYLVWYTRTYKYPSGRFRSSRIEIRLDFRQGVYFETHGFDCTEPVGEGSCSHFEFIPSGKAFQEHMDDRTTWDRIRDNNIGGLLAQCLRQLSKRR